MEKLALDPPPRIDRSRSPAPSSPLSRRWSGAESRRPRRSCGWPRRCRCSPTMLPKSARCFSPPAASERAPILHNLATTPLKPSTRIPPYRAARAIEILQMAAFAADVENFARELGDAPDAAGADRRAGGGRSRRRAAGLRRQDARHAGPDLRAGAVVPRSGARLIGQPGLPVVAALRRADRANRADHGGGMARLDRGGDPGQIPPCALRRRTAAAFARRDTTRAAQSPPTQHAGGFGRCGTAQHPARGSSGKFSAGYARARSRKCRPALSSISTIQTSGSNRISLCRRSSTLSSGTGCGEAGENIRSTGRLSS